MRSDLQAQLDSILSALRRTQRQLGDVQSRSREIVGRARSRDNLVYCTVAAGDSLTDLHISPRAMRRYGASELATTIVNVVQEAKADLVGQVVALHREVLGDSFQPEMLADAEAAVQIVDAIRQAALREHGGQQTG